MSKKHTIEEVRKFFGECGCELVETKYENNLQLLRYRCKCSKLAVASFKSFSEKKHCKLCSLKKKYGHLGDKLQHIKLNELEGLFSMTDVAKIVGIDPQNFWDMVRVAKIIPAPTKTSIFSVTKRREYYSEEDIREIELILKEVAELMETK